MFHGNGREREYWGCFMEMVKEKCWDLLKGRGGSTVMYEITLNPRQEVPKIFSY